MSLLKTIMHQLGLSVTPANNFTLTAEADNGTMKLARGNAGATTQDILTVDANGLVTFNQGRQLTSGTAQATTSGTSIDFTSIPSWVKRITVEIVGVSTNGTSLPIIQLGDSGGIEATGYSGATATVANSTGFNVTSAMAATTVLYSVIVLNRVASSPDTWMASVCGCTTVSSTTAQSGAGSKALSDVLTTVRLTTVNGTDTFDAGSVNILYEG